MMDLNSVLIEGVVQSVKTRRGTRTGCWVEVRNRRPKGLDPDSSSHCFRIEVRENLRGCPPTAFTCGQRIRVVGSLRRESRIGPVILAEHVEWKTQTGEPV